MKTQWPAHKIEQRALSSLLPYARNSRTHTPQQVDQVAASIKEWGWTMPVLIDEAGTILAGHCRCLAAEKLGIEEIPCLVAKGWSEAKKRAYIIADNKLALNAGWDLDLLKLEFEDLEGMDYDLSLTGFDKEQLKTIMGSMNFDPGSEDDQGKLDELDPVWVTCPHCGKEFDSRES